LGQGTTGADSKRSDKRYNITKTFGRGFDPSFIVSSAALAILCLFYVFSAAAFVELTVYPLVDRITYVMPFTSYVTTKYADHVIIGSLLVLWLALASKRSNGQYAAIGGFGALFLSAATFLNHTPILEAIALASLPAAVSVFILDRYTNKKILDRTSPQLTLNYIAAIGIAIGLWSIALSSATESFLGESVRNYAYEAYLILTSFSPVLILLLIACIPVKLISDYITRSLKAKSVHAVLQRDAIGKKYNMVFLALILLLSIIMGIIPHLPSVNPTNQQVGVDTGYYVTWVSALHASDSAGDLFTQAFVVQNNGERPLSLLFLYGLSMVSGTTLFFTVEFSPLILAPALALVTFFVTRELTSNDTASLFAAFITAVSFHTLIGIYAGFYANWLALVIGYLSLLFLFRYLKQKGMINLILFGSLTLLVLFTHVYTWSVLSIAAGIFLVVGILRPQKLGTTRKTAVLLMAALLSIVAVDVGRSAIIGSSGGVERDLELAESLVGPEQYVMRWNNLSYTTTTFVGGLFASFIVLALGLYWLVRTKLDSIASVFIVVFLSLGILPFMIGEWVVQTRVFYNIPFQIPAGIALAFMIQNKERAIRVAPICIFLLLAAIVAVSNFYLVAPAPSGNIPLG
jgi:hypothetical protein